MSKKFPLILAFVAAAFAFGAAAHAEDGAEPAAVREAMHTLLPNVKADQIIKSDLPGFYEVIAGSQLVYISADGKYLLHGSLYHVPDKRNLTEARIAGMRAEALRHLPREKRIVFAPEHPKHTITVFTDVDCPYCRQFHKQIAEYNKAGIAVNYILFPLDIHPGADKKAVAVWCAKDRNAAYSAAMSGVDPGSATCDNNPVAETKALSITLGIDATPTVLAEDGTHVSGGIAMNPAQLAAELDRLASQAAKEVAAK